MNGLRALSGSSVTRWLSMTMPRSAFDVSMSGDSPMTVTVSEIDPTCIVMLSVTVWPTSSCMRSCVHLRNPSSSAASVYTPGFRNGSE